MESEREKKVERSNRTNAVCKLQFYGKDTLRAYSTGYVHTASTLCSFVFFARLYLTRDRFVFVCCNNINI